VKVSNLLPRTAAVLSVALFTACANVPHEVVHLSNTIGEDMAAVHESHRSLIKQHFANIRQQRLYWIDSVWAPRFIEKWIAEGRLIDIATGKVVYDESKDDFVSPSRGQEGAQLLKSVHSWADAAVAEIDAKRKRLLGPVDKDEQELLVSVNEAFERLFRGNAAITAHLNSLRKVQGVQDDVLRALHVKDLRVAINQALAKASDMAALSKEEIDELDKELQKAKPSIEQLKQKIRKN